RIANAVGDSFSTVITEQLEQRKQDAAYSVRIVTIQPATVPVEAAAPNTPLSVSLGAILGLAAGLGIAILRSVLDRRIRSVDELEAAVDAPVIGAVPDDPTGVTRPLVVAAEPHAPRAEAYRTLRT